MKPTRREFFGALAALPAAAVAEPVPSERGHLHELVEPHDDPVVYLCSITYQPGITPSTLMPFILDDRLYWGERENMPEADA